MNIRTRFAPSPTGLIHVGGIRTALFAYLLAKKQQGSFVLRIEDTDQKREQAGSTEHIYKSLRALGIQYDEGPDAGGDYGPYKQSERLDIYTKWAQKLIDSGRAYADPYTPEQVQTFRDSAKLNKQPFLYRNHRPDNPPAWDGSTPLRFKSDPKDYQWTDAVMGDMHAGAEAIDDFIIMKSDGFPTYNFAHIVDDYEMAISHVLRGQEFTASVPNYLNLHEALDITAPTFATLPHVLGESGNKKLSKRDGARDVLEYINTGYLPEALMNFIATLGWNDGTTQEIFSHDELVAAFDLSKVQKGGARFDEQRLNWMNGSFIRELALDDLYERSQNFWPEQADTATETYKKQVLSLVQERLKYLAELPELSEFFFADLPLNPMLITGHKQLKKYEKNELRGILKQVADELDGSDFSAGDLQERLNALLEQTELKPVVLFSLVRIATTQAPASPGLADTMAILGRDVSLKRIATQIAAL